MRWMTGGELAAKPDPILCTHPGSSTDTEDVAWAEEALASQPQAGCSDT